MQGVADTSKDAINVSLNSAAAAIPGTQGRQGYDPIPLFRDLYPCTACFCTISSCYFKEPECYGCSSQSSLCCTRNQVLCCRPGAPDSDVLCLCSSSQCELTDATLVCQTQSQACCADNRCALPPDDEEAPCLLTCLFVTLYFKDHWTFEFFKKGSEMR